MSKSIKNRSPKNEPDNHAKIPEPTITANKLSYEPNFNEKYFSEELTLNNQTQLSDNSNGELAIIKKKKLKKTLETVGLHLVETKIDDMATVNKKSKNLVERSKGMSPINNVTILSL